MTMRLLMVIIAALAFGCGTVQPSVGPEQETLVDEFPSKPYPYQRRPGKDGRCSTRSGPPTVIVKGGGCWLWVDATPEECAQAQREGEYLVPYQGRCYYPMLEPTPQREPTSSLKP
jgi:hypothetical protein